MKLIFLWAGMLIYFTSVSQQSEFNYEIDSLVINSNDKVSITPISLQAKFFSRNDSSFLYIYGKQFIKKIYLNLSEKHQTEETIKFISIPCIDMYDNTPTMVVLMFKNHTLIAIGFYKNERFVLLKIKH